MVYIAVNQPAVVVDQATEQAQHLPLVAGLVYGGSLAAWTSVFSPTIPAAPTARAPAAGLRITGRFQVAQPRTMFQTDDHYDLAIEGHGFLQVMSTLGETFYTRDGALQVSEHGALMTASGAAIQPAIVIPQDAIDVTISRTGEVQVKRPGAAQMQTVGQIKLATFANEAELAATDDDRFLETRASGPATVDAPGRPGVGTLLQGYVEASDAFSTGSMLR